MRTEATTVRCCVIQLWNRISPSSLPLMEFFLSPLPPFILAIRLFWKLLPSYHPIHGPAFKSFSEERRIFEMAGNKKSCIGRTAMHFVLLSIPSRAPPPPPQPCITFFYPCAMRDEKTIFFLKALAQEQVIFYAASHQPLHRQACFLSLVFFLQLAIFFSPICHLWKKGFHLLLQYIRHTYYIVHTV